MAESAEAGAEEGNVTTADNPLQPFLQKHGVLLLDGGLATTLEAVGHSLQDDLWSARLLLEDPQAIRQVHEVFLHAGADCILTASYQASLAGFRKRGLSEAAAAEVLRISVRLGQQARSAVLQARQASARSAALWPGPAPLVAASVGPYGAALADGSEYHGDYGVTSATLRDFHESRWQILAASGADLLACETIPSHQEVQVLLEMFRATPSVYGWISVTCRDGAALRDGSALRDVFAAVDGIDNLVAVAVNCTAPRFIASCIREMRRVTAKPILVYPNAGERYDARRRTWVADDATPDWSQLARQWRALGAQGIGGCCRVGPDAIRSIRNALVPPST
jgi:homocysteine S-methyltransferase